MTERVHRRQGERTRKAIFQTGIDFAAGTATNGSPTTVELDRPLRSGALAGLSDFSDVFALSNLPSLTGSPMRATCSC